MRDNTQYIFHPQEITINIDFQLLESAFITLSTAINGIDLQSSSSASLKKEDDNWYSIRTQDLLQLQDQYNQRSFHCI
jgi:hypothetical protein